MEGVINQKKEHIKIIFMYTILNALNLIIVYSSRSIAFAILGYNKFIFNNTNSIHDEYGHIYSRAYQESRDIVIAIALGYIVTTYILFILIIKNSLVNKKFKISNKWHIFLVLLNCIFVIIASFFLIFYLISR